MIRSNLTLCLFFIILGLAVPTLAVDQIQPNLKTPVKIELNTYPPKISAGQHVWIAVTLTLDSGWHIYGNPKGPGPGLPTTLIVTSSPKGVQANTARFLPAKKLIETDLGLDEWVWAYQGMTTIYLRLSTPNNLASGHHQVQLRLRTLLCREGLCLPYQTDLVAVIEIITGAEAKGEIPPLILSEIQRTHAAETVAIKQARPVSPAPPESTKESIPELYPRAVYGGLEVGSLIKAALFALLAGLILNFMPCVLPVVSIKVLGFVQQAEESGRRVVYMGLSFAGGIFAVFLVLAALASFAGYGWGELFQKQPFLIVMIALVFTLSLCLFGLFNLPIPHFGADKIPGSMQRQGYFESFYKGILATFLATPCSGPLLGGAMAWTLRQPPVQIFAVFSCMGLGMASPYVVMSLFPGSLRWFPKPGPWLIHFERLMGFALLATVVYLLTIVTMSKRIWVILFCLFLALGFYVWGQMTTLSDSTRRRLVVRCVALLIMVAGGWLSLSFFPNVLGQEVVGEGESLNWQPYADAKLLAAASENRWVVIDFTADWCPNCILVEETALKDRRVLQTFRDHDVLLLKADLTRENPPAQMLLRKLGSRSIPFLALFPPGEQFWQPYFLRDIYRAKDVIAVFRKTANQDN
ncbi:MAG: thioredoxin family protein [Syntrophobacterales bacterium]|jgi:thiol:disulfide interchange protein DsbD